MNNWISVKDKLPPNTSDVLIYNTEGIFFGYYVLSDECWYLYHALDSYGATHWMPLPKPPKTK